MAQTGAHTAVDGAQKAGFPPFDAKTFPSQLFWLVLVFVCLYMLVAKFIYPRMEGIVKARAGKLNDDLKAASNAQKNAEDALKSYEETVSKARFEAQKQADDARAKAAKKIDSKREKVQAELSEKLQVAEAKIAEQKKKALAQVSTIARDVTQSVVSAVAGSEASKAELDAAFKTAKSGS